MKVNKEQFKEFLTGLGFKRFKIYNEDTMYSDLFGDMWVYFTGTEEEISSETRCIINVTDKDEVDLAQFVLDSLEAKEKQTFEIIEGW